MTLIKKLKTIIPRENSGSVSSNRFDYQKNWAICKLIDLSKKTDFLLVFEFYEDIIVFDSSDNPNVIDFYQVKTKEKGKHSISSLLNKTKGSSILGKLFANKINFNDETSSLNIIANCDYKLEPKEGEVLGVKICCSELSEKEKKKIAESLSEELSITWLKEYFKTLFFEKSMLTIEHHTELTQQKLNKHIEEEFNDVKFNPTIAYSTIFDEIKRRNNIEKSLTSFEELIEYKSISKTEFDNMIKVVGSEPKRIQDLKSDIINRIDAEKLPLKFRRFFKSNWSDFEVEYLKPNNLLFKEIEKIISQKVNENEDVLEDTLINSMNNILNIVIKEKVVKEQPIFDENLIKIMILKDICDGE